MANTGEVSFYKLMGRCIKCFYDAKGVKRDEPARYFVETLPDTDAGNELLSLLGKIVEYGMSEKDGVFPPLVKKFYCANELQTSFAHSNGVSVHTLHTQMRRSKNKFEGTFGKDVLFDLMGLNGNLIFNGKSRNIAKLKKYENMLVKAAHKEKDLYKYVELNLNKVKGLCEYKEVDDYAWMVGFQFLTNNTPAGKSMISSYFAGDTEALVVNNNKQPSGMISVDLNGFIGYVNYILNMEEGSLEGKDLDRYRALMQLISLNEMMLEDND